MRRYRLRILGLGAAFVHSLALFFRGAAHYNFEIPLLMFGIIILGKFIEHLCLKKFNWSFPVPEMPLEKYILRVSSVFVPVVIFMAAMAAYVHFGIFHVPPERALNIFICALICASPETFSLAVPTALAAGFEAAKKRGETSEEFSEMTTNQVSTNVFFAFSYNIFALTLAVTGFLTPVWAALLSAASSIILILGSLSLKFRVKNLDLS